MSTDADSGAGAASTAPPARRGRLARALPFIVLALLLAPVATALWAAQQIRFPPWWRQDEARQADGFVSPDDWGRKYWAVMSPAELPFPVEPIEVVARDGITLRGWYWRRAGAESSTSPRLPSEAEPAVLLVHGGGADRRSMLKYVRFLHEAGYAVAAVDIRGHGTSDGDRLGLTFGVRESRDVVSMIEALEWRGHGWIALLGDSVGGASSIIAASKDGRARAVISQNAYADFAEFATDILEARYAPRAFGALVAEVVMRTWPAPYENVVPAYAIPAIAPRPVLILQGADDALCLEKHAHKLYAAAAEPKELFVMPRARHATLWNTDPKAYEERVLGFLARARAPEPFVAIPHSATATATATPDASKD